MTKKIAVLYHIFYEDSINHIEHELKGLHRFDTNYFFNLSAEMPNQLETKDALLSLFPNAIVTISSNKGKDIGGKLLLLGACMQAGVEPDWIVFLHDKKSLQALNAKTWKNDLFKIVDNEQLTNIEAIISKNNTGYGIIAMKNYVRKELRQEGMFTANNGQILSQLIKDYNINCTDYEYVAGTMFWAKASALMAFFRKFDPLKIRQTLEGGNVIDNFSGTYTHSWERMLSWIVTSQGLKIKTLE
ncbi:rhamnan synthesis F family protein [Longitalea luteola]|uniref:rhamnan synthesis F family protein n=1 Tax=Longitalea luteola TaxID=2812563 RepID=UPI001A96981A|nr:rhamnan synthesis F family protein [Longitalea luteola]